MAFNNPSVLPEVGTSCLNNSEVFMTDAMIKESFLGVRTISREVRNGMLVHTRLVRHGGGILFPNDRGPVLSRITDGLHLEVIPGEPNSRVPSFFSYREDGKETRFKLRINGVLVSTHKDDTRSLFDVAASAVQVDHNRKEITPWMEVELEYCSRDRSATMWVMKQTAVPRPVEIITWDEAYDIIRGRTGSVFTIFDPEKDETSEYRILKEGEVLVGGLKNPVEHWSATIAVGVRRREISASGQKYEEETPAWVPFSIGGQSVFLQPPYILANGELNFLTSHGWRVRMFPPVKQVVEVLDRTADSEQEKPNTSGIWMVYSGSSMPGIIHEESPPGMPGINWDKAR